MLESNACDDRLRLALYAMRHVRRQHLKQSTPWSVVSCSKDWARCKGKWFLNNQKRSWTRYTKTIRSLSQARINPLWTDWVTAALESIIACLWVDVLEWCLNDTAKSLEADGMVTKAPCLSNFLCALQITHNTPPLTWTSWDCSAEVSSSKDFVRPAALVRGGLSVLLRYNVYQSIQTYISLYIK